MVVCKPWWFLSKKQLASIPKSILGIERTNNTKELAQIYTAADVFFNPTYEDNYPTTNLEAIACGTPVVTYDTGGSPESISNKKRGLVVGKGNLESACVTISLLIKDVERMNDNNDFIDKDKKYYMYVSLYEKLT